MRNLNQTSVLAIARRAKSVLLSSGAFFALIGIWTLITYYLAVSTSTMARVAYVILCVCTVVSSVSHAYSSGGKGWLNGLIGGAAFLVTVGLVSSMIVGFGSFHYLSYVQKFPLYMVMSLVGGIIGVNLK